MSNDPSDHVDDDQPCCPDCGGAGGHLYCIEGICTCSAGDECWVDCPTCGGED